MIVLLLPILKTTAKSPESTTYLQMYLRVLTEISACTYPGKYDVLAEVFTRKYSHVYAYLLDIRIIEILLFKIWCGTQYRFYLWKIYVARKLYI